MKIKPGAGETAEIVKDFLNAQPAAGPEGDVSDVLREVLTVQVTRSADSGQTGLVYVSNSKTATLRYTRLDLCSMLSHAYDISGWNIEIAPELPGKNYDFLVHVPKASEEIMKPLLRQAVKAVYGVEVRQLKKEKRVLLLRRDKGAATPGLSPGIAGGSCSDGRGHLRSAGLKMNGLARALEGKFSMPVLDETGLAGLYRVELAWAGGSSEALSVALKDQLGLLLVPASRSVDVLEAVAAGGAGNMQGGVSCSNGEENL